MWLPGSVNAANSTIASATLTLGREPFEYNLYPPNSLFNGLLYEVIEDYRQQTLLSVVTAIGGFLSALQGLHTFLFEMPLFWGLFGM